MLKRILIALITLTMLFYSAVNVKAYAPGNGSGSPEALTPTVPSKAPQRQSSPKPKIKGDNWVVYWYACGTDIETTRILLPRKPIWRQIV